MSTIKMLKIPLKKKRFNHAIDKDSIVEYFILLHFKLPFINYGMTFHALQDFVFILLVLFIFIFFLLNG